MRSRSATDRGGTPAGGHRRRLHRPRGRRHGTPSRPLGHRARGRGGAPRARGRDRGAAAVTWRSTPTRASPILRGVGRAWSASGVLLADGGGARRRRRHRHRRRPGDGLARRQRTRPPRRRRLRPHAPPPARPACRRRRHRPLDEPLFGDEIRIEHWTNAAEQARPPPATCSPTSAGGRLDPHAPCRSSGATRLADRIQFLGPRRRWGDDPMEVQLAVGSPADGPLPGPLRATQHSSSSGALGVNSTGAGDALPAAC